ncbi:hypothetical protein EAG18_08520 [Pseudoalteromonas sp. J010]|uniref:hypothetical protein n=1 Tax=Pseudoalteromonas sp. J010 TaxID=998465 RepID=UPI000F64FC88|nr:hypothetical protein [Pseudoalteromonas sp. J010]RRS09154.1 hypothetical protein EAG18_08520 [Pseudoalteromonas sp. J010]
MSLIILPHILAASEQPQYATQSQFKDTSEDLKRMRIVEGKPALLVVLDADKQVLASSVGYTQWSSGRPQLPLAEFGVSYTYRKAADKGDPATNFDTEERRLPIMPALRFNPTSKFAIDIRNSGTAAQAFIIVDQDEVRSKTDITDWPNEIWDGSAPLDVAQLTYKYFNMAVGLHDSQAPLQLTRLDMSKSDVNLPLVSKFIDVYFTNMFHDWSDAKAQMEAALNRLSSVDTLKSGAEIEALGE